MKKYMEIAEKFPGVVCLQIFGDESPDTRKLMVSMKVKVRRWKQQVVCSLRYGWWLLPCLIATGRASCWSA